jgi:hypothetical protein
VVALVLFFYIVYDMLTVGRGVRQLNPYKFSPKFIAGALVPMMADYPEP